MTYDRVLLVNPQSRGEWRGIRPHIGLGYIAESLSHAGIRYDVLDMNFGYGLADLQRKIDEFKPGILGVSLLTLEYKKFYSLLTAIKGANPDLKIAVGGPHATILRDQVLRDCPAIDYGVVFEGEGPLTELCQGLALERIEGLLYREGGDVVYTGDRPFLKDLDRLPWPKYERFELKRYVPEAEIYSSRGCPHNCIFCPNRIISPVFRVRSPEHVVDEMQYWYDKGYRQFNFDDDNFNMIRERVYSICDEIERRRFKDLFLRCSNGIRADRIDRDLLVRMKEVGFRYIAFGVDAGNDKMLEVVKKGETMAQIEQAVAAATELSFDIKLLFVVGTPQETWDDVLDKVKLSKKYPIQDAHFYNIIPYPGTELFDWIKRNGLFLRQPEEYLNDVTCLENTPVFETPELPAAERIRVYSYLEQVRDDVHRDAIKRMYGTSFFGRLVGAILTNKLFMKLFYQNLQVRKFVEHLRYKRAVGQITG